MSEFESADGPVTVVRPRASRRNQVTSVLLVVVVVVLGDLLELLAYLFAPIAKIPAVRRRLEKDDAVPDHLEVRADSVTAVGSQAGRVIRRVSRAVLTVRDIKGSPALHIAGTADPAATIDLGNYDVDEVGSAVLAHGWPWQPAGGAVTYPPPPLPATPTAPAADSPPVTGAGSASPVSGGGSASPVSGGGSATSAAVAGSASPVPGGGSSTSAAVAGSASPVMGAGSSSPAMGGGSVGPVMGAGSASPAMGASSAAPATVAGSVGPVMGAGSATPVPGVGSSTSAAVAGSSTPVSVAGFSAPDFEVVLRDGWTRPIPSKAILVLVFVGVGLGLVGYLVAAIAGVRGGCLMAIVLGAAVVVALCIIAIAVVWTRFSRLTFVVGRERLAVTYGAVSKLVVHRRSVVSAVPGRRLVRVREQGRRRSTYLPMGRKRCELVTALVAYGWPVSDGG